MSLVQNEGYSATVDIRLEVDGACFAVAQVGEQSLILADDSPPPPQSQNARLVITVDGEEFPYSIVLCEVAGLHVSFF